MLCACFLFIPFVIFVVFFSYPITPSASPFILFSIISTSQFFLLPYVGTLGFSHEKLLKTHWTLLSWPITSYSIIYAKICAWIQVILISVLVCFFWILSGKMWYNYDYGLLFTGILQIIFTAILALSLTFYFSVIFQNPWSSVGVTQLCFLVWILSDFLIEKLPKDSVFTKILYTISYRFHSELLQEGIISWATIVFFTGLITFFISKSYTEIERLRGKYLKPSLHIPLIMCVAFLALIFPCKIDTTFWGISKLQKFSKKIISQLENPLYITYYSSASHIYDPHITAIWNQIRNYEKNSPWIIVKRENINDFKRGTTLGLQDYNGIFSGAFIEYKSVGTFLPLLIQKEEIEYQITTKIYQILSGKPIITLKTGNNQSLDTYSFLTRTLQHHFEVQLWEKGVDLPETSKGIIILSASSLDHMMSQQIFSAHQQGRGVFIGYSGISIPTDNTHSLKSYESLQIDPFFEKIGLRKGNQFILDPEGFSLPSQSSQDIVQNYPAWPKGFYGKSTLWQIIIPIFSTPLWANSQWEPLLLSSLQSSLQQGTITLEPSHMFAQDLTKFTGPYTIAIQQKTQTPFIVVGSETLFSDIFPIAKNFIMAELLAWNLVGLSEMANLKLNKMRRFTMKRPYSDLEDAPRLFIQIGIFLLSSCTILSVLIIKRRFR